MSELKLHIGCGRRNWPGWYNIDIEKFPHVQHNNIYVLPFADNSVDEIYSSHMIAYLNGGQFQYALEEWYRVLKPNGILRIATPDLDVIMKLANIYSINNFLGPLFGYMKINNNEQISHKTGYTFDSLVELLHSVGFKDCFKYDFRKLKHIEDDHSRAHFPHSLESIQSGDFTGKTLISLNIECIK